MFHSGLGQAARSIGGGVAGMGREMARQKNFADERGEQKQQMLNEMLRAGFEPGAQEQPKGGGFLRSLSQAMKSSPDTFQVAPWHQSEVDKKRLLQEQEIATSTQQHRENLQAAENAFRLDLQADIHTFEGDQQTERLESHKAINDENMEQASNSDEIKAGRAIFLAMLNNELELHKHEGIMALEYDKIKTKVWATKLSDEQKRRLGAFEEWMAIYGFRLRGSTLGKGSGGTAGDKKFFLKETSSGPLHVINVGTGEFKVSPRIEQFNDLSVARNRRSELYTVWKDFSSVFVANPNKSENGGITNDIVKGALKDYQDQDKKVAGLEGKPIRGEFEPQGTGTLSVEDQIAKGVQGRTESLNKYLGGAGGSSIPDPHFSDPDSRSSTAMPIRDFGRSKFGSGPAPQRLGGPSAPPVGEVPRPGRRFQGLSGNYPPEEVPRSERTFQGLAGNYPPGLGEDPIRLERTASPVSSEGSGFKDPFSPVDLTSAILSGISSAPPTSRDTPPGAGALPGMPASIPRGGGTEDFSALLTELQSHFKFAPYERSREFQTLLDTLKSGAITMDAFLQSIVDLVNLPPSDFGAVTAGDPEALEWRKGRR